MDLGWIGIWLLIGSAVVIAAEGALAAIWTARIARRSRALSERLAGEQARIHSDLAGLQSALVEMQILSQPYRRAMRWLRHPLAIALLQSYARRAAR